MSNVDPKSRLTFNSSSHSAPSSTRTKGSAASASSGVNPFGNKSSASRRPALEILQESFYLGVRDFDRGVDVWNPRRKDPATGKISPGFEHQPNISLEPVIEFTVNEGKGTGRQVIPACEFRRYVEVLRDIHESGYEAPPEADRTVYVPTHEIARSSFSMTHPKKEVPDGKGGLKSVLDTDAPRNIVSVRCASGKGQKPMTVPRQEFLKVVEALEGVANDLDNLVETAWKGYDALVDDGTIDRPDYYPEDRLAQKKEDDGDSEDEDVSYEDEDSDE